MLNTCSALCTHIDNIISTRHHSAEKERESESWGKREKPRAEGKKEKRAFVIVLHLNDHRLREHEHYVILQVMALIAHRPPTPRERFFSAFFSLHRFLSSWCHPLNPPSADCIALNTLTTQTKRWENSRFGWSLQCILLAHCSNKSHNWFFKSYLHLPFICTVPRVEYFNTWEPAMPLYSSALHKPLSGVFPCTHLLSVFNTGVVYSLIPSKYTSMSLHPQNPYKITYASLLCMIAL